VAPTALGVHAPANRGFEEGVQRAHTVFIDQTVEGVHAVASLVEDLAHFTIADDTLLFQLIEVHEFRAL